MNIGNLDIMALYMGNIPASAYMGDQLVWPTGSPTPPLEGCLTFNIISAGTIVWTLYNSPGFSMEGKPISYSINDGSWQTITATSPGFSFYVDAGEVVKFKGENDNYGEEWSNCNFGSSTAVFEVEGNIMSLIYGENFENQYDFPYGSSYNFSNLFRGCTGLTSVENLLLPATALTVGCYQYMFYGCSQIETAPVLPAAVAVDYCYQRMFTNCSSLSYIKCMLTNPDDSNVYRPTYLWVSNVSGSGIFVKDYGVSWGEGDDGIPFNWTVQEVTPVFSAMPLTFKILSGGNLNFYINQVASNGVSYRVNNGSWSQNSQYIEIQVSAGDVVEFKGVNPGYATESGNSASFFSGDASYNVYGNIASLLYGDNFVEVLEFGGDDLTQLQHTAYTFAGLFRNADGLISVEHLILPFTALTYSCYDGMFKECHNLTGMVQSLPATQVATQSYRHMFAGCRSLTEAPRDLFIALSGGTLPDKAASSFFYGCSALTKAPILYATGVTGDCYGAFFRNCPELLVGPIVCARNIPYNWQNFLTQSTKLRSVAYYAATRSANLTQGNFAPNTTASGKGNFYKNPSASVISPNTSYWNVIGMTGDELYDPRELYDHIMQDLNL